MTVQEFLSHCEDVRTAGKGWLARCPAHDDKRPSLSVNAGDDSRILLKCRAGCDTERVVSAVGLTMRDLFPQRQSTGSGQSGSTVTKNQVEHSNTLTNSAGLTLALYAEAKGLSVEFLHNLGLSDTFYIGRPAVRIPYYDADRAEVAVRFRLELVKSELGDNRFRWKAGAKPCLYGLWRLEQARAVGHVTLVEGESDTHTLWSAKFPAIGIPGATSWREEWADHFDGIEPINIVIEPDRGGDAVRRWLERSRIRDRVRLVRLCEHKDPSALYLDNPAGFYERWKALVDAAEPWVEIAQAEKRREADEAYLTARDLLNDPSLLDRIGKAMRARGYAGDLTPPKLAYVAITSRLLERPLNLAFVAPSAAGKNRAVDAASELFPPEAIYVERAGSARALVYADESFEHRTVIVAEADSIPEDGPAASAVRSLAADNLLAYDVVEKNAKTGAFKTRRIEKPGPTGLVTTSTRSLGEQMGTRVLEITLCDDADQTRQVMKAHARSVLVRREPNLDNPAFLALQRWLASGGAHQVIVPFAETLAELVPPNGVRMRRDFRQLLTCIQAVALLYQRQREIKSEGEVEATIEDYKIARELLASIFETLASEGVTPAIRQTVEAVIPPEEVTVSELAKRLGLVKSSMSYRVGRAIKCGWLVNNENRKGHPARVVRGSPMPDKIAALPDPEQLMRVFECSNASRVKEVPLPAPLRGREFEEGKL